MIDAGTVKPLTARGRLAGIISGKAQGRGAEIVNMILNSPDDHRLAALNFISQSMTSKAPSTAGKDDFSGRQVLLSVLRAQRGLIASSRERLHQELKRMAKDLVPAIVEMLPEYSGGDLHLLIELATTLADPALSGPLKPILGARDRFAAVMALQALAASGGKNNVSEIKQALDNEDLRWTAVAMLADLGAKETVGAVARLLVDPSTEVRLEAIRALTVFQDPRAIKLFKQVCGTDPSQRVRDAAVEAVKRVSTRHGIPFDEAELTAAATKSIKTRNAIDPVLAEARLAHASDVHLVPGSPIAFRLHGLIKETGSGILSRKRCESMIREIVPESVEPLIERDLQADFSYGVPGLGRHRVNVFQERRGLSAVIRLIPPEVPGIASLGLPPQVNDIATYQQGLVLVTGRSGSGKTTTMSALVNHLNETRALHIITLEDPIEYIHYRKRSLVNQREIGRHTESFPMALRSALREDPDVIVVGEMRDLTTMRLAVEAAETGHLVIGTLHTPNAVGAVERMVEVFPASEQQQVRLMLADSLKMVIAQSLIPRASGPGRVGCFEILVCTSAVSNLIRDNKMNQLPGIMQTGKSVGMKTMDSALFELMASRSISSQEAYVRALNKEPFQRRLQPTGSQPRVEK
ncbi:MAG: PilT/PilU family type 4a pilus ATPase [Deltaproteobacteria bacterium]|nr:PilT/PilU family type 4a pilus ATPase [Deltaproteobacteria bacterium]